MSEQVFQRAEKILENAKVIVENTVDKAIAYNNVVILAAYGGLFALLGATKDHLSNSSLMIVGVLLVVSLLCFVLFTLVQIFIMSITSFNSAQRILNDAEALNLSIGASNELIDKAKKNISLQKKAWVVLTAIAVVTGLISAGVLMHSYLGNLFEHSRVLQPDEKVIGNLEKKG